MTAPQAIIDALESVLSVYFSNVRHRVRAAFLLCDELVEMTCKAKAKQANHKEAFKHFHDCLKKPAVALDPATVALGQQVADHHTERNNMQHATAAGTVDDQYCADAIIDAVAVIDHCFNGTSAGLNGPLQVLVRVTRLHSRHGDPRHRALFEIRMREHPWNKPQEAATTKKRPVAVGERPQWGLVLVPDHDTVRLILDEIGAP